MNINQAFPSKYLKAADLDEQAHDVTITRVEMEAVGREKEMKAVAYVHGFDKGIVLNKTNATAISKIAGSWETDEWVGVTITLFTTYVEYGGEQTEAIRVRAPKKKAKPASKPAPVEVADYDDEVPI